MVIFPLSKINLGLDIINKLPDGYHSIETIMIPIGWTDVLEIVPASGPEPTLTTTGNPVNCPPHRNLVIKAFEAVKQVIPDLPAVDIFLRKIVPDGAGLGGGSADAAATVKALNSLFQLGLGNDGMAAICSRIGADCPFFIYNVPMLATGKGTELSEISIDALGNLNIMVVKPPVSVSTVEAYSGASLSGKSPCMRQKAASAVRDWKSEFTNSFEASIFPKHPQLAALKQFFYDSGAIYASMSGSGSAIYGLFEGDILADSSSPLLNDCQIWCGPLR